MKKGLYLSVTAIMVAALLSACGASKSAETELSEKESGEEKTADAGKGDGQEVVNFWYLWGGEEGKRIEEIIDSYNKSQDRYKVVGLSTPDQQKVIAGISGGSGPDITDDFGSNISNYAAQNIALPLEEYIEKEKLDRKLFLDSAIAQQEVDGKLYALPISSNVMALYYNKKLLQEGGYTEPPKTMEELQEMSKKLTKVENGTLKELGAPFVPGGYAWPCLSYAAGTNFGTPEKLTPDNEGFRKTLDYLSDYVKEFGASSVNSYISSGNSKLNTAQDPFLSGEQALRIDGPWFYDMAKDAGLDFGVTMIPSYASQGEKHYSYLETSNLYIPSTAKNKDGAWDFLKYMTLGEGAKDFAVKNVQLPARRDLLTDPDLMEGTNEVYREVLSDAELVTMPNAPFLKEYSAAINSAVDSVLLGGSPEEALSEMKKSVDAISR